MIFTSFRILLFIILPILVLTSFAGIKPAEEGYIVNASDLFLKGLIPYRDFDFAYTPLSIFITSLTFQIFDVSLISSRILVLTILLTSSILIFKIIVLATRNKIYALFTSLIFTIFTSLFINYPSPILFGYFTGFSAMYLLMKFLETRQKTFLFPAGFLSFVAFLAHQGFGLAIFVSITIFFFVKNSRHFSYISNFVYGYLWGLILFVIYLLATNSFAGFVKHLFSLEYSFQYIASDAGALSNPSIPLLIIVLHIFTFIIILSRRRFHLIFLQVFATTILILNFTSPNYMILISLIGISLSLSIRYSISTNARTLFYLSFITIISWGLVAFYIRFNNLENFTFVNNPKVLIFADKEWVEKTNLITKAKAKFGIDNDEIFIASDNTLLYFWLDITTPTFLVGNSIENSEVENEIIGYLVAKDIEMLIVDHKTTLSSKLKNHITKYYYQNKKYGNFDILIKNP